MKTQLAVAAAGLAMSLGGNAAIGATADIAIDADDIGGVVTSAQGPEAGVWVIAETDDLHTNFIKIVVTDNRGRYVLPDLPKANYRVWVRGYGLVDSKAIKAVPGKLLNVKADRAPDARAAAEYYPANYWFSLIRPPAPSEFPGTGPKGNGISPGMASQQDWLGHLKEQCHFCHQLGDLATRVLAAQGNSMEAWDHRLLTGTGQFSDPRINKIAEGYRATMSNNITRFGRERGLKMFSDWTDRIAAGETPPQPPRPAGVERNVVLTMWNWAVLEGSSIYVHDIISTDKRNPTVNSNNVVYGTGVRHGLLTTLNPITNEESASGNKDVHLVSAAGSRTYNIESMPHNPMIDQKGRVWTSNIYREGADAAFCSDSSANKFAKYFPNSSKMGRHIDMYDPATGKVELIPTCFGTHHLNFGYDKDNTLYYSGDTNVMGWINTRVWDETHDPEKAQGWCPMVLDTNGDGKVAADHSQWNAPEKPADPKKDTRITSFLYGMNTSPVDGSIWFAKFNPTVPSGVVRFEPGTNPPETCKTEFYAPPKRADGSYEAFNARGVDIDSKGVAWVAFGSGQVASFDRHKCKVLNGPQATGQQCPEGWTFYNTPGPKITGTENVGADWHYLTWVDLHNVLGLGKDVPIVPGDNSDSLLAILPETGRFAVLRVPYPMGFYTRGMDGRIDDADAGWKGRGLWTNYAMSQPANLHTEGGVGKLVKFQLRPDPLAH